MRLNLVVDWFYCLQDSTLEKENIKNGDVVIVEEGRIPPKVKTFSI